MDMPEPLGTRATGRLKLAVGLAFLMGGLWAIANGTIHWSGFLLFLVASGSWGIARLAHRDPHSPTAAATSLGASMLVTFLWWLLGVPSETSRPSVLLGVGAGFFLGKGIEAELRERLAR
jgi:hypothetical protein